jgi:4-amino-4-deoxy-L-arabinose transferase-like glycosyltransferase
MRRLPILWAALFTSIFVFTAALSVRGQSSTWDDVAHLSAGLSLWQTGDPRLNSDHPPLARLLGALPAVFLDAPSVARAAPDAWNSADFAAATGTYAPIIEDRLLWPGRLSMLSLAILLGALLYAWSSELHGVENAWFTLALYAFCPVLLANAPLVTTDMAATTFIFGALYAWWRYQRQPSRTNLLMTGLLLAAALTSKYSALVLLPLFVVLGAVSLPDGSKARRAATIRSLGIALAAIFGIALLGINLIYCFDGSFLTPAHYLERAQAHPGFAGLIQDGAERVRTMWPSWLPVPLPFYYACGIANLFGRVTALGHATYFLGEAGLGGWPNYFVMLLLVKLTIPLLILVVAGLFGALSERTREWRNLLFLITPIIAFVYLGSSERMQIGFRHILPVMPFLLLLATYAWRCCKTRVGWLALGGLLVWNEASSLAIHPDYLMYFNFIAGGANQGWRISVTGDDYGQSDAELSRWLQARNVKQLAFGGFGWGNAVLYRAGIATKAVPCQDTGELVAAHLGSFLVSYTPDSTHCYDWMRDREPDAKIGHNIFIYNALAAGAPEVP